MSGIGMPLSGIRRGARALALLLAMLFVPLFLVAHSNAQDAVLAPAPASANTIINTHITTDTTWSLAGSPYEVQFDTQVFPGATLIVEPGVEVRFAQQAMLDVRGKILATGTISNPILFTGSTQTPGWWDGIHISGATGAPNVGSVLEYVTIEYGGYIYGNLYFFSAEAKVDHAILRHSLRDGLYGLASTGVDASNITFNNNGEYAVYIYEASGQSHFSNLTATDNGANAIALRTGIVRGERRFENAGLPYHIIEYFGVYPGGVLTIEPGVEVAFNTNVVMDMRGILYAVGTAADPIVLTGMQKVRGAWTGLFIQGLAGAPNNGSILDHVTLEYGGNNGSNLRIQHASVQVRNSTIRQSGGDGVVVYIGGSATWIESSSIVDNSGYGVRNTSLDGSTVIATGNWWGSATGPTVATNCNDGGQGSLVSANVEFSPFLTEAGEQMSTVAPLDLHQISISTQRWYIPADGVTQAEILLTLRTGEGNPIAGQPVFLHSTLGTVQSGGVTDGHGQSRARVKSTIAGEAVLTASVTRNVPCSSDYRSGTSTIHFTPFQSGDIPSDAAAPYVDNDLQFSPMPIVQGVTTQISARLVNSNSFPIFVNGTFGILQSGMGLSFPPVGSVEGFEVPANSARIVAVDWVPPITGHYCIVFDYNWTNTPGTTTPAEGAQGPPKRKQKNLNAYNPETANKTQKENYDKAVQRSKETTSFLHDVPIIGPLLKWLSNDNSNLKKDPPRQDYTIVSIAEPLDLDPIVAGNGISAAQAQALNTLADALNTAHAHGAAAIIAFDRYGGATLAHDLQWASVQVQELNANKAAMGSAYLLAADALEAWLAVLEDEQVADEMLTLEQLLARQQQLASVGYPPAETALMRAIGMSDDVIATMLADELGHEYTAAIPSFHASIANLATIFRDLGGSILYPPTFGMRVGGGRGLLAAGVEEPPLVPITNNLARLYEMTSTVQLGNPKDSEQTIDLRVLPIELPAGWAVEVTPREVTLDAGAVTTVTLHFIPSGPTVQGTSVRVAVEGHIGNELIGGVVAEMLIPYNVDKVDTHLLTFLPVVGQ